jgi:hypothetical protein
VSQLISAASNSSFNEFDTKIPSFGQTADIVEAFRLYHYGKENFITGQDVPADNSIYAHLVKLRDDVEFLENAPRGGGVVSQNVPHDIEVGEDRIEIPEGFIWLDEDSSGVIEISSGTVALTNEIPLVSGASAHGVVWVDKDQPLTDPFNLSNFLTLETISAELADYLLISSASATYAVKDNGQINTPNINTPTVSGGTISNATSITLTGDQNPSESRVRNIIASTSNPTGGNNGDIWIKYV